MTVSGASAAVAPPSARGRAGAVALVNLLLLADMPKLAVLAAFKAAFSN